MIRNFLNVFLVLLLCFSPYSSFANNDNDNGTGKYDVAQDPTNKIICRVLQYIWRFGGPLITVVIIGSALLAIFGKMQWSALVALAAFICVFFGATSIVQFLMTGITFGTKNAGGTENIYLCEDDVLKSLKTTK